MGCYGTQWDLMDLIDLMECNWDTIGIQLGYSKITDVV